MAHGLFISFEGGDGSGKSTQVKRLTSHLEQSGRRIIVTREPGGSEGAEAIRNLLVNGPAEKWDAITEALLMYASRADHVRQVIRPALERGDVVISDRFSDSTMAYQGYAGELGVDKVSQLDQLVLGGFKPHITFVLEVSEDVGLTRAKARGDTESRFEQKGDTYQAAVKSGFLQIARNDPDRCVVIDANRTVDAIGLEIATIVDDRFGPGAR